MSLQPLHERADALQRGVPDRPEHVIGILVHFGREAHVCDRSIEYR